MIRILKLSVVLFVVFLSACNNNYGTLEVRMTNVPPTMSKVLSHTIDTAKVTISDISVHRSASAGANEAGWTSILLVNNVDLDLMTLNASTTRLLGMIGLPAGAYQQIRITVASASITLDGSPTVIPVTISSGVVKLNLGVTIVDGHQYSVKLNFDADTSLSLNGNTWRMAPPVIDVLEIQEITL